MATRQQRRSIYGVRNRLTSQALRLPIISGTIGGWVIGAIATATMGQAQQVIPLPPPPNVSVSDYAPYPTTSNQTAYQGDRDKVFLAPIESQGTTMGRYLVYINGDSPYLLQQVRLVEPRAFVQQYQGRAIIQAGTFESEANARQQIAALSAQGIMADIAPLNTTQPSLNQTSHYLVVIPGSREDLPKLASRAVRLGIRQDAIQQKDAPLGPHLEIGPFTEHSEAQKVTNYLNGDGLDARVYYNR